MIQIDDFKTEGVVASGSAVSGQSPEGREAAHRLDHSDEGVTGWADTTMMHVDAPIPTAPICGWNTRFHQSAKRSFSLVRREPIGAGGVH
jgi:hypothetical protein